MQPSLGSLGDKFQDSLQIPNSRDAQVPYIKNGLVRLALSTCGFYTLRIPWDDCNYAMEKSAKIISVSLALRHAWDFYNSEADQELGGCLHAFWKRGLSFLQLHP